MGTQTQLRTGSRARYNGSGKKHTIKEEIHRLDPKNFDLIPHSANRMDKGVNTNHVKNLKSSMMQEGFLRSQAIIVDENLNIIDGHHRFTASKELGIPLYYKIVKNADIFQYAKVTSLNKSWSAVDWVQYHASSGNKDFMKLSELMKSFNLKIAIAIPLAENVRDTGVKPDRLYRGSLRDRMMNKDFDVRNWGAVWDKAKMITQVRDRVPLVAKIGGFQNAWLYLSIHPRYEHKRMLQKLDKYSGLIKEQPTYALHLEQLLLVYNYRTNKNDKLKLSEIE